MNIKNRIIFDLSQARPHRYVGYHGGGVYAYKFFLGLLKELESNGQLPRLIVTFDKSRKLDSQVKDILKDKRIHNVYVESIEDIISTIFAYNSSDSTVILPMPYKILAKLEKKPESKLIATIHGLRELQFKKERYLSWYKFPNIVKMLFWWINSFFKENTTSKMFEYLKINDQILTDSHFSKKQINKFLDRNSKLLKQNIKVIYPPISDKYKFNNISKKIDYPYFLSVSASRPVKNCIRVLDAINYYNLFKAFPDWKYVLTGVNKNLRNLIKYRYKKLYPNLVLFDYITTEKLHELYSQSSFSEVIRHISFSLATIVMPTNRDRFLPTQCLAR